MHTNTLVVFSLVEDELHDYIAKYRCDEKNCATDVSPVSSSQTACVHLQRDVNASITKMVNGHLADEPTRGQSIRGKVAPSH